jgi:hypothetical protein
LLTTKDSYGVAILTALRGHERIHAAHLAGMP